MFHTLRQQYIKKSETHIKMEPTPPTLYLSMQTAKTKRLTHLSFFFSASLVIFFLLCHPPAFAQTTPGIDVVLLVDDSGSMKKNDPSGLRKQAAKLFLTLLNKNDQAALVSFSRQANTLASLMPASKKNIDNQLKPAVDKLSAKGSHTNLHDALTKGYSLLKKSNSNNKKVLILMSDGKMDVGNSALDLKLTEDLLDQQTHLLAKNDITVHAIAFTEQSNIALLRLIAKDTKGQFNLLKKPKDIHLVFESLFEKAKSPDMLPLNDDSFIVDEAIKEITIVTTKYHPNAVISLETPNGNEITEQSHDNAVRWYSAQRFDLITLIKPSPGYWKIKYSEGGNKAYIVSNLKLSVTYPDQELKPSTEFLIQAALQKNGKIAQSPALLDATSFLLRIHHPDGSISEKPLKDTGNNADKDRHDGIFGTNLMLDHEGVYKISVIATSETFDRQKTIFVSIASPQTQDPFKILDKQPVAEESAPAEHLAPEAVIPPPESHQTEHGHEQEKEHGQKHDDKHETNESHPTKAHDTPDSHSDEETAESPQANHEDDQHSNLLYITVGFLITNLIIGSIGAAIFFLRKLKKNNNALESEEMENDDNTETPSDKKPEETSDENPSNDNPNTESAEEVNETEEISETESADEQAPPIASAG